MESPLNAIRHRIDELQQASASTAREEELLALKPAVVEAPQPLGALPPGLWQCGGGRELSLQRTLRQWG
jgi:hypothetical protein